MKHTRQLLFALFAGLSIQAETAPPVAGTASESKRSGYAVSVEFDVDSAGSVANVKVVGSEAPALNDFALSTAQSGKLNPQPLPPPGSEAKHVSSELFYPVDAYDSGKPLPTGVSLPSPIFQPCPVYPFEYRKKNITGGVWLSLTVGKSGTVTACKVIRASHPNFGPVAEQAVYKWKFRRATLDGKPVEVTFNVPIAFELSGQPRHWRWVVAPRPTMSAYVVTTI